jgi:hypothetical protein
MALPRLQSMRRSRWVRLVLVAAISTVGAAAVTSPASAAAIAWKNMSYPVAIQFLSSGKCLDDPNSNSANDTPIDQWTCDYRSDGSLQTNQQWRIQYDPNARDDIRLQNVATGKCLNVSKSVYANDTPIILYTCSDARNEVFNVGPDFADSIIEIATFVTGAPGPNYVFNVSGNSTTNGAKIILYKYSSTATNEEMVLLAGNDGEPCGLACAPPVTISLG